MRAMPKSIDYQDILPMAVPAIARRKKFFPNNGPNFNFMGTNEIRIEISSPNSLLDTRQSYMQIDVTNQGGGGANLGWEQGGVLSMFDSVRVEQGGRVLSETQAYNRLNAGILSSSQESTDAFRNQSITEAQRGNSAQAAALIIQQTIPSAPAFFNTGQYSNIAHNDNNQFPNGATARFTFPILSGLFNQDKLLPLPLVRQDSPITIVLRLTNPNNCGTWNGGPAPFNALNVINVNYVAQLIEVGGDVLQQIRSIQDSMGGQLAISSTDIEHTQGLLPANVGGEQVVRCPINKRSIKSLFFLMQSDDYTNGAAGLGPEDIYNMSYAGSGNMDSYQLKVGSVVYPPTPIECWGNVAAAVPNAADTRRAECAIELAKALGSLGYTNPTGRLNTCTYGVNRQAIAAPRMSDGDNGDGVNNQAPMSGDNMCICPFGLDMDSFQHTALEAGVDSQTMALETNLILNINAVQSGIENKNVHMWMLYDQHYYFNKDGMITFSN